MLNSLAKLMLAALVALLVSTPTLDAQVSGFSTTSPVVSEQSLITEGGDAHAAAEIASGFAFEKELKYEYTDVDGGEVTVRITYTGSEAKAAARLRKAVSAMQKVFPPSPIQE